MDRVDTRFPATPATPLPCFSQTNVHTGATLFILYLSPDTPLPMSLFPCLILNVSKE